MKLGLKKKVYFEPLQKAGAADTGGGVQAQSSCVSGASRPRPPSRVAGSTSGSIASDRTPRTGGGTHNKVRAGLRGWRPRGSEHPGKRAPGRRGEQQVHGREPESTREVFTGHSGWLGQITLLHPVPKSLPWSPIHSQPCVYTWARIQFHTHTPPVPFPLVSDLLALGVPEPEPRTPAPQRSRSGCVSRL